MAGALTAAIAAAFAGGVTADPYFEYTTLLLPGSGTNGAQNNTFLDASTNNFTITRNGNTTQGTFSPFSQTGWGNYFDGSGDYLATPSNSALAVGAGDFCIETWIYWGTSSVNDVIYSNVLNSGGGDAQIEIYINSSNKVVCGGWNTNFLVGSTNVTSNAWTHIAVCRSGTTMSLFLNGSRDATTTTSNNFSSTNAFNVGRQASGAYDFLGYISNLRVVKGSSVYDPTQTTLTVPTAPLTAISGTSLLTCQSNRFIDNSTNNFAITVNGNTSVQAFSPFNPTSSWSATTNGGSGYFDGNGDYLTAPSNAAFAVGSVFTIEFWLYPISYGANPVFIFLGESSGDVQFGLNSGNLSLAASGVAWRLTGSKGPVLNAWNHCVLVRSGTGSNQTSIFLNGERIANGTVTDAWTTNVQAIIQSTQGSSYQTNGYMSGVRIVKGTAVYDPTQSTLTVPTAPLTAITNTSLLLNFTNAGIYDATSKNDLETVGNAQISTAQYKFPPSSMAFDGTGDYLTAQNNPLLNLGSSNFTIEAWIYPTTLNTYNYLYGRDGATNATSEIDFYIGSTGNIASYFYSGSTGYLVNSSGGAITTNSWQHVALVRNGVNYTIYVNGTSVATIATLSTLAANTVSLLPTIGNSSTTLTRPFTGYIQDFRFTRGYARYTANFTPPTAAFPTL